MLFSFLTASAELQRAFEAVRRREPVCRCGRPKERALELRCDACEAALAELPRRAR